MTYQVDNESGNAATGTWTDSVYLSTQTTLNSSSVLLGRVQQTGVAADGQYSQTRDRAGAGSAARGLLRHRPRRQPGPRARAQPHQHRAGVDQSRAGHAAHARRSAARSRARSPAARASITSSPFRPARMSRFPPTSPRFKGASSMSATRASRSRARTWRPRRRRRRSHSRS